MSALTHGQFDRGRPSESTAHLMGDAHPRHAADEVHAAPAIFYFLDAGSLVLTTCSRLDAATSFSNCFSSDQQVLHLQFLAFVVFFAAIHSRKRSLGNVFLHMRHVQFPLFFGAFGDVQHAMHFRLPAAVLHHI